MTTELCSRVAALGKVLPEFEQSTYGNYEPWVEAREFFYFSGQVSIVSGVAICGRLGDTLSLMQGNEAAELCATGLLSRLDSALSGDLDRLVRVVRLQVYVASSLSFSQHGEVANGASDLFIAVLAERGRHARTAIGVCALPRGAAVEIDMLVEVAGSTHHSVSRNA